METLLNDRLSFFAALFNVEENGTWPLYLTIVILSIIVYKLGFAKKLPLLKQAVIYIFLALGGTILTALGIFLPVAEGLVVAALILIIYKIRLHQERKESKQA